MSSSFVSSQLTYYASGRIRTQSRRPSMCSLRDPKSVPSQPPTQRCKDGPPSSISKARVYTLKEAGATNAIDASARRSADYHPSVWGDYFLKYERRDLTMVDEDDDKAVERIQELKSEVKAMLDSDAYSRVSDKLNMIDQIQRLGIAYHFDREIKEFLGCIHTSIFSSGCVEDEDDLHSIALRFRLLRQHGHWISSGVFDKFKDREGNFHAVLIDNVRGMLSLYEASHYRIRGEETLEEALGFCLTGLKSMEEDSLLVSHALKQCLHREIPRIEARRYFDIYQTEDSHSKVLANFAKLDFNLTQKQHQMEVATIARWWKDLDFRRKLLFARDRVVECYFWILGVYFEPEYSLARIILTKVLAIISIVDDIYDVYGTLEELKIFTEAIERWDSCAIDGLPGYMQVCYSAILNMYGEIEGILAEQGRLYYVWYAKEALKIMVRGYFQEAKWFHRQHIPTVEEYMDVARVTAGYRTLTIVSLIGMPELTTRDTFDWLVSDPKIVKASATACRLMDDIASHKFEQERAHMASAVECYMKQYGVTEQEAEEELKRRVEDAWKVINEECLRLAEVPNHVLLRIINFTRMLDVVYGDGDCYTHSETKLKNIISSLLVHPVTV